MSLSSAYDLDHTIRDDPTATVFRGRRKDDGESVVLKALKAAYPRPGSIARLKHEYRILDALDVPGVLRARALETGQPGWAIVLEDFDSEPLTAAVGDSTLELVQLLRLAIAVVEAIGQIHDSHVIHKDLNPANILWDRSTNEVKLINFGIATQLAREKPAQKRPDVLEGTLAYISPEQTGRMNAAVDYRADFYSLGATLYELLTGRPPFLGSEAMELVHSHIALRPVPPHEVSPRLPKALSGVVMRLLEKTPEARYQSSFGVQRDLELCLEQLEKTGEIADFSLGEHDVSERFLIPQRLYGREAEVEALESAFLRTLPGEGGSDSAGNAEMVRVFGPAGIGKSALVRTLYGPVSAKGGFFIAGKFEQLRRGVPYSAVVQAFRLLVEGLLAQPEEALVRWRGLLARALGANGRIIIDVLPQLELIIGPQPKVQKLGPVEAGNRFDRVLRRFIQVFARPEHPLVIFLDDLQWADWASLQLIKLLMTGEEHQSLLLLGAYRDSEVGPTHLLSSAFEELREAGVAVREIRLAPLALEPIAQLVADTVASSVDEVIPLAESVARSTEGNPLFVTELLRALHDDGLVSFDRPQGRWVWNVAEIEARGFTENVLELMVEKLGRLPDQTLQSLQLAACIGSSFDPRTLSIIQDLSLEETVRSLVPAIENGVVFTTSVLDMLLSEVAQRSCSFFHDRLQQAAYGMLDEKQRSAAHLKIGRLALADLTAETRAETLFDVVDQLNYGHTLIADDEEKLNLVALNLEAGKKARASTAYVGAVHYLRQALGILPPESWDSHYELTLEVHTELAIAENLTGDHERSEALTGIARERARTALEKAEIENIVVRHSTMAAHYSEAIEGIRRGLALFDRELPVSDLRAAVQAEFEEIAMALGDRPVAALVEMPTMTDPVERAATRLLLGGFAAAFYIDPLLYSLMIFRAVNTSLRHGHPPEAMDLYSYYGHLLSSLFGKPREGKEFGELAVKMSDKVGNLWDKCRSSFILANFIHVWVAPLREAAPTNKAGFEAGLESGELQFAAYILYYRGLNDFYCGRPLPSLCEEVQEYLAFNRKVRNTVTVDTSKGLTLALANLSGRTSSREVFATEDLDEETFLAGCEANQTTMGLCYYNILKTQVLGLYGEHEQALAASALAEDLLDSILGNVAVAEHAFHTALSLAAVCAQTDEAQRQSLWSALEDRLDKLRGWAEICPQNFAHMQALVEAEMAACSGQAAEAILGYERAIDLAAHAGFPQDLARANELAGRFWQAQGRERLARIYLGEARLGYRQWGAEHKLAQLEAEYPWLQEDGIESAQGGAEQLDLGSVIRASQVISGEIVLDRLLRQLMRLVIENAGAQRGVLLINADGRLRVEATAALVATSGQQELEIEVQQSMPLATYREISHGVVDYAARTTESVILNDALGEGRFTRDPYILKARPRSVLCAPLASKGQVLGFLYLENNLITGAFGPERLEVLGLLSTQFVISLENARLYDQMERKVELRTEELSLKNTALEQAMDNLRSTQDQLVHSEKMASLGQLTAGVAHEINNPLNFVNNFAELGSQLIEELLEEKDSDSELRVAAVVDVLSDLKTNIETIRKHGKRATSIVTSMLQHARGTTGERERVDLNTFVGQYINLAKFGARTPGDETRVSVELRFDDAAGSVEVLPQEFGQVLVNLLNNAFDAVRDRHRQEQGTHEGMVTISTHRDSTWAEVRIADNGVGIPAEIRDKIFQPFFTTKSGKEGTGLGLSLCYEIMVEGHGGKLTVESRPGEGTTFVAALPVSDPDNQA